mgnify:CR=1 FL=1
MPTRQPHILLVHADQHRFDCIGASGNPDIQTPNIDKLAAEGRRYTNHFCSYPVCTPSRYSLLTGLYTRQHQGWTNHSGIPPTIDTFPRILKREGYKTAAVGKMHFTPTYLDVGFEEMVLAEQNGPGRLDDDYHRYLRRHDLIDAIDTLDQVDEYRREASRGYWDAFGAGPSDLPEAHHSTTWIGDRAMEQIDTWRADEPALLMVGFIKPHHPFDPPASWAGMYDPDDLALLPGWTESALQDDLDRHAGFFPHEDLTPGRLRRVQAMYYATISHIDHQVGRMVDLLKQKGLYGDTLIVYTSDHGDYMGFHHMLLKGNALYDPLARIPLVVKFPGHAGVAGDVSDALCSNIDMAPTILAQAGCRPAEGMAGLDLVAHPEGRDFIFAEAASGREYMIRSRTRKLIVRRDREKSQFFNLEQDIFEERNLYNAPEYLDEIGAYSRRLTDWALFEALTPNCLDEEQTTISQANVLAPADGKRDEMEAYVRCKMAAAPALYPATSSSPGSKECDDT